MLRRPVALTVLALSIAGCGALKDALTSHTDTAAQAGSQELSSKKLAEMMAAAQMPARKDLALAVANLWVNYHLLGEAGARADSMAGNSVVDEAMWAQIAQSRLRKFQAAMQKAAKSPDEAGLKKAYDDGDLLAARHILIMADKKTLKPNQLDSARRVAEGIRKQVTPANFVAMVTKYSGDPGSKDKGGEYIFPAGQMVKEFEAATRALKPGEISPLVQTDFGFHIILREAYEEVKTKFDSAYSGVGKAKAESIFVAALDKSANIKVKDGAGKIVKSIAEDVDAYRTDKTVVASSNTLDLRASRVAHWVAAFPVQMQIRRQLMQAPDSAMPDFLKNLMRTELLLKAADSAKIVVEPAEMEQIRTSFRASVANSMNSLGVSPKQLADSAKSTGDREKLASARIDAYMVKLLKNEAQFVDVSEPVSLALRRKYDAKVTLAGVDKAITLAADVKTKADSAQNANMPKSEVPMPGAAQKAAPPGGDMPPQAMIDSVTKAEEAKAAKKAAGSALPPTKKP